MLDSLTDESISSRVFFLLSMPRLKTISETITKTDANIKKIESICAPLTKRTPTNIGANMPPIRPKPAAQPDRKSTRLNSSHD